MDPGVGVPWVLGLAERMGLVPGETLELELAQYWEPGKGAQLE